MTDPAEIDRLAQLILELHGLRATHVESVPVTETHQGQTVWDGLVEVFEVTGHPQTKRAYAWAHEGDSGGRRYVAVLGVPPVRSPRSAVKAAIVAEYRARKT